MGQTVAKESLHGCKNLVSTCTGEVSVRETAAKGFKYRGDGDGNDWENSMGQLVERMENVAEARQADEEFPEDESVLGVMSDQGWMVRWVPAEMAPALNKIPAAEVSVYQHMTTKGIADGCGHAWLVAAIAAMCDYPDVIVSCFKLPSNQLPRSGTYTLRVFNPRDHSKETEQTINDVIPLAAMSRRGTDCDDWTPLYIRPTRELFACLIEKACARMLGSYAELEHGTALFGWAMLSGCSECYALSKDDDGMWTELEVTDLSSQDYYTGEKKEAGTEEDGAMTQDEVFDRLSQVVWPNGYVVGASTGTQDSARGESTDPVLDNGLVAGHVYGVRRLIKDGALKLVQLRDPWVKLPGGSKSGWIGDWGNGHASWNTPAGQQIVQNNNLSLQENDAQGFFWMAWADFCDIWDTIQFAKVKNN